MKNIMITGASGMLGRALLARLSRDPALAVYAVSSRPILCTDNIRYIPKGAEEACLATQTIDCLIHAAFPRGGAETDWADGLAYGYGLLFAAKRHGVRRILHISSQSLYGWERTEPADESAPLCLVSPYTTGKFCTEQLVSHLFEKGSYTNIRLATLIGPHSPERVPNRLIAELAAGRDLRIKGGGQTFAFLHVEDAAEALCRMVCAEIPILRPHYNVGTEEAHTLSEIAQMCLDMGKEYGIDGPRIITEQADIRLDNRLCCAAFARDFGHFDTWPLVASLHEIFAASMEKKS